MDFIQQLMEGNRRKVIPIMTHPGIEALGRTVKEAVGNGQVHFEAIRYLAEHYDTDACTVIMDLTVEAEAFGAQINMPEEEVPSVIGRLVCDEASVQALPVPTLQAGRVQEYLRANKLAAEYIKNKPVLSGCIGPYSLAGRLYDMSEIMMGIYIEPKTIALLLEKCTAFLIDYCRALKATGTAGVIVAEPAAGLLSNEDCQAFSTVYVQQIVEAVQDDSFAVILHNCGNTGHCTEAMVASGARALHFGNRIDMVEALQACPPDILVMGNLDPVLVFKQASATEVASATADLLNKTKGFPHFVLSSGCDLPPHVPHANLEAFFETVRTYNKEHA